MRTLQDDAARPIAINIHTYGIEKVIAIPVMFRTWYSTQRHLPQFLCFWDH